MDLKNAVARLFLTGFRGLSITATEAREMLRLLETTPPAGVLLFDRDVSSGGPRNIRDPHQVRELTHAIQKKSGLPLLIAIDQEGGAVRRLKSEAGFFSAPSAFELGKGSPDHTLQLSRSMAVELKNLGINLNFAPVVDLALNSESPVLAKLGRCFGDDPEQICLHAKAFIEGHRTSGIKTCLKHFPGHGSSSTDTHKAFTDISQSWRAMELEPYANLIRSGHADSIMVGHLFHEEFDDTFPATLSESVVGGLLRKQLHFSGMVVSDDLQMKALTDRYGWEEICYRALNAGIDVLVVGNNLNYEEGLIFRLIETVAGLFKRELLKDTLLETALKRGQTLLA